MITIILKREVPSKCPKCKDGLLMSAALSRLEEGLGHCGYQCDRCQQRYKYIPEELHA